MMYRSYGLIKYSTNPTKVIVEVDQEILRYYFKFIPKAKYAKRQGWPAHISVVRKPADELNLPEHSSWNLYQDVMAEFYYGNQVSNCETYYWLSAYCRLGEEVRRSLGLEVYDCKDTPMDFVQRFHITLGNIKPL